jgi:hypothetical protein
MICHRPSLELSACGTKPQAPFYMKEKERKEVMTWMKNLKFPDGFATGFRRVVNLKIGMLTGLKIHDYHVIMEWILLNMLWGYMHQDVWKTLAELSYFVDNCVLKKSRKKWRSWRKRLRCYYASWRKYFLPDGLIKCNIYLFIFRTKLR